MEDIYRFSERLKIALDFRNKKPIDVADGCNLQRGTISLYLHNKRIPKKENIYKIADYLQINRAFLLGISDNIVVWDMDKGRINESEKDIILADINNMCARQDINTLKSIYNVIKALVK